MMHIVPHKKSKSPLVQALVPTCQSGLINSLALAAFVTRPQAEAQIGAKLRLTFRRTAVNAAVGGEKSSQAQFPFGYQAEIGDSFFRKLSLARFSGAWLDFPDFQGVRRQSPRMAELAVRLGLEFYFRTRRRRRKYHAGISEEMAVSAEPSGDAQAQGATAALPFVAPCRSLSMNAPLRWLKLGWMDLRRAPRLSLGYGILIALLSFVVTAIGIALGSYWAALVLLSGFVFVAPVLALGLYSISRQLERGYDPSITKCLLELRRTLGTAMVFALALLVLFLVWARAGSMVHVFFPVRGNPNLSELAMFLAIGSAVGSLFALCTFLASAFSLPMICDRDTDAVTAIVSSVNAALRNKRAMAVWILVIVGLTALGFATALVGLAVTMPWLGHATWHAYRETIDAQAWPVHEVP